MLGPYGHICAPIMPYCTIWAYMCPCHATWCRLPGTPGLSVCPPVVQYYYVVCERGSHRHFSTPPPILIGTPMGRWRLRRCAAHVLWMKVPRAAVILCVKGGAIAIFVYPSKYDWKRPWVDDVAAFVRPAYSQTASSPKK